MKCFACGKGKLERQTVDLSGTRNGEEFTVRTDGLLCTRCGFKTLSNEQSGVFTRLISDAYRRKYGLLTSNQIRDARKRLRMTQKEFADYLGVGVASVKRWEIGKIQDQAMNRLILLMTDPVEARRNYQRLNGDVEYQFAYTIVGKREAMYDPEKPIGVFDSWQNSDVISPVC